MEGCGDWIGPEALGYAYYRRRAKEGGSRVACDKICGNFEGFEDAVGQKKTF